MDPELTESAKSKVNDFENHTALSFLAEAAS